MATSISKAVLILALSVPVAPAFPAEAPQDPPPAPAVPGPAEVIDRARAEAVDLATKRLRALADAAWGMGLKATAAGLYRHLLEYSVDDFQARSRLGWKRRGAAWERGEAAEPVDAARAGGADSFATRRARELAAPAESYARLAALLEKEGRKEESRAAYESAFRLDPSNAAARRARGDLLVDGKWVPAEVVAYRALRKRVDEACRALQAGPSRARPVAARSKEEELLGVDLARARSPRFFSRIDGKPADAARVCDTQESALDLLDVLLGTSPAPDENPGRNLIILADERRYKAAIENLPFDTPEAKVEAFSQIGTFLPDATYVGFVVDPKWLLDLAAHKAGEAFLRLRYRNAYGKMWLRETFGVLGAALVLDSHETFCVQVTEAKVLREDSIRPSAWPPLLAADVARGKDLPLRTIVGLGLENLSDSDVAKTSTMVQWWEATRPGSTARFLDAIDRGKSEEQAAMDAFGAGIDAQDDAWRRWIAAVASAK